MRQENRKRKIKWGRGCPGPALGGKTLRHGETVQSKACSPGRLYLQSVEGTNSPAALELNNHPASLGLHVLIIKSEVEVALFISYMKSCCPKEDK